MYRKNNENTSVKICPHCKQKKLVKNIVCPYCGYDESKKEDVIEKLYFGLEKTSSIIINQENSSKIAQEETTSIKVVNKINSILMLIVGLMSILLMFIPLFSDSNITSHIDVIKEGYGYPTISDCMKVSSSSNVISLLKGVITCITDKQIFNPPGGLVYGYEITTICFVFIIAILGLIILLMAIRDFFFNKKFYKYKTLLGVNLTLLLVLYFAFGCYGVYVLISIIVSIAAFILMAISGILSKEKKFVPVNLTHKSICVVLLLLLLILSSVGLVTLNVDVGADLFNNETLHSSGAILPPKMFLCNGLFIEVAQFIQSATGDDYYSTVSFAYTLSCFITHVLYLAFISMAFVSLLKSLSKQSVRFPIKYIVVSTVFFYAFAISTIMFNSMTNEAAYQNYININGLLTVNSDKTVYKVFSINVGMWISIVLNLPTCIYCFIAKRLCLKKVY